MWNIIGSGLPAALLQCLYLFFTFPLKRNTDGETNEDETQKMLVEVRYPSGSFFLRVLICLLGLGLELVVIQMSKERNKIGMKIIK